MHQIPNNVIRQILHLLLILAASALLFWHLQTFLPSFLGAYTLFILLRKPQHYLTTRLNWRVPLAAITLLISSLILVILPINGLIKMISSRILPQLENSKDIIDAVEQFIHDIEVRYNLEILTQEHLAQINDLMLKQSSQILSATVNSLGIVAVMYFVLYFLLTGGARIENLFTSWLPLSHRNLHYFRKHLNSLVYSNALGIPLVSFLQSLVALFGYWVAGVSTPFLWFVVSFFSSFIPFLGAMVVYVPLSIMLLYQGQTNSGIFLLLYGFIIVGSVDNLFRLWIQKKMGDTHPLITLFGAMVGIKIFGFIGLIFGPILISLLLLLIDVYFKEYGQKEPAM